MCFACAFDTPDLTDRQSVNYDPPGSTFYPAFPRYSRFLSLPELCDFLTILEWKRHAINPRMVTLPNSCQARPCVRAVGSTRVLPGAMRRNYTRTHARTQQSWSSVVVAIFVNVHTPRHISPGFFCLLRSSPRFLGRARALTHVHTRSRILAGTTIDPPCGKLMWV